MRKTISVESRVAMSLQRLGTGNTLCIVGEVYGVAVSTILLAHLTTSLRATSHMSSLGFCF